MGGCGIAMGVYCKCDGGPTVSTADARLYKYLLNCGLKTGALDMQELDTLASLRDRSTRAVTILESVELEPKLPSRTDQPHLSRR